jgi:hypothetical protein
MGANVAKLLGETPIPSTMADPTDPRTRIIRERGWSHADADAFFFNSETYPTTIDTGLLRNAGLVFAKDVGPCLPTPLRVLEVYSGNGFATQSFQEGMLQGGVVSWAEWISTDIHDYGASQVAKTFHLLDAVSAVKSFGSQANVLLMISPPPCPQSVPSAFCDYFAIEDFIAMPQEGDTPRYIVLVGEIGRSDGTEGLGLHLKTHDKLYEVIMHTISEAPTLFGDTVVKSIAVYFVIK